jgi:nucleotide-binding universal stress UspA family protein
MLMPTKILVPTDFSEPSNRALEQALDMAKQYNAKVFLLNVLHRETHRTAMDFTIPEEMLEQFNNAALAWAQQSLQKQLDSFPQAREVEVASNVRHGIAYEEILKEAKEQKADLIVIASLGRSGIAKYLIGSVARNVLKGSKCPVLLTK